MPPMSVLTRVFVWVMTDLAVNARYLILDKDKELLKVLQTNCKNLLTKEAFQAKFPNIRL